MCFSCQIVIIFERVIEETLFSTFCNQPAKPTSLSVFFALIALCIHLKMARTCRLDRSRQNLPSKRRRTAPPMPTFDSDSSDSSDDELISATAATAARLASQVSPTPETGENGNDSRKLLEPLLPDQIQQMLRMVNNSSEVVANQRVVQKQFNPSTMSPVPAACLQNNNNGLSPVPTTEDIVAARFSMGQENESALAEFGEGKLSAALLQKTSLSQSYVKSQTRVMEMVSVFLFCSFCSLDFSHIVSVS